MGPEHSSELTLRQPKRMALFYECVLVQPEMEKRRFPLA